MKKITFNLIVCNFIPEKVFVSNFGRKAYYTIERRTFEESYDYCAACGHKPMEYKDKKDYLQLHISHLNKEYPEKSKAVLLCRACHSTQHIDFAIEKKWIKLVNSDLSQEDIVRLCRGGNLINPYDDKRIVNLLKTPEELLQEIKSKEFKPSNTLKIIFTNDFVFNDL